MEHLHEHIEETPAWLVGDPEIDEFIEQELKFFEAMDKKHKNRTPTPFIDMKYEDLFFDYL